MSKPRSTWRRRRKTFLLPLMALLAAVAIVRYGYWCWVIVRFPDGCNPVEAMQVRGQFGDMFGAVNALFSGMAFAVLIFSLRLRRRELTLQRKELRDNRRELEKSADSQDKPQAALTLAIYAQTFIQVRNILQDERVRDARRVVLTTLRNRGEDHLKWTPEERGSAERVCRTFDTAGMMAARGMVPLEFVAEGWHTTLGETWAVLSPYVRWLRQQRGAPKFWEHFERTAASAAAFAKDCEEAGSDGT